MLVTGTFSAPGTSAFCLPVPNASFSAQLSGTFSGALCYMTVAVATSVQANLYAEGLPGLMALEAGLITPPSQSAFALMYQPGGKTPITFNYPGGVVINPPFTSASPAAIAAGGASIFVYQLVCVSLGSGTINWQFSQ